MLRNRFVGYHHALIIARNCAKMYLTRFALSPLPNETQFGRGERGLGEWGEV